MFRADITRLLSMYRKKLILSKKLDACENESNDSVRFDQSGEFDEDEEGEPGDEGAGSDSGASRAASPAVGRSHKSHHKVPTQTTLLV